MTAAATNVWLTDRLGFGKVMVLGICISYVGLGTVIDMTVIRFGLTGCGILSRIPCAAIPGFRPRIYYQRFRHGTPGAHDLMTHGCLRSSSYVLLPIRMPVRMGLLHP